MIRKRTWVGTFCIHRRRGVIKWPVHGIFRLSRRDAAKEKENGNDVLLLNIDPCQTWCLLTRHVVSVVLFFQGLIFRERDEARTRVSLIKRQIAGFNSSRNWWKRDDPYNETWKRSPSCNSPNQSNSPLLRLNNNM